MTMEKVERRMVPAAELRLQRDGHGTPVVTGYAIVFDSLSEDLGGFRERVKVGSVTRSLREGADVRALVDHDPSKILGRNLAGTLRIKPNAKGVLVEIDAPDTQAGRDIVKSIDRGDVTGMSFAFTTQSDEWHMEDGTPIRDLLDVDLHDVSVVTYPAYRATDVAVRSTMGLSVPDGRLSEFRMRMAAEEAAQQESLVRRAELMKRS